MLALGLLAAITLSNDSLRCRMIDWLDAPTNRNFLHEPVNDTWPAGWSYSGTGHWDLAMGDSVCGWLPGSRALIFVDAYNPTSIDTSIMLNSGSLNKVLLAMADSILFVGGGGVLYCYSYENNSVTMNSLYYDAFADYHFAALEDSFLYTDGGSTGLTRINVANPESIFIDKTYDYSVANSGLEIVDQRAINLGAYSGYDDDAGTAWPYIHIQTVNFEPPDPVSGGGVKYRNRFFGGGTIFRGGLFTVNSYMSDYPDWAIGQNNFYRGVTDLIYTFDSHWDGQAVFCVEALNENIMAAGFEHGISVLNIQNLDSIYEVAYYMDLDSTMDITHLAMKESRIYAMGHPRDGYVRLYMFDVGDSVETGQCEAENLPTDFRFWNYPNPFNSSVKFAMDFVPEGIEIYDVNGRLVEYIHVTEGYKTLPYEVMWNPHDLSSGIYFARIQSGKDIYTTKLIYLQ